MVRARRCSNASRRATPRACACRRYRGAVAAAASVPSPGAACGRTSAWACSWSAFYYGVAVVTDRGAQSGRMTRMLRAVLVPALAGSGVAMASPVGVRAVVETPPEAFTAPISPAVPEVSPFLYLNRSSGGCVLHGGTSNDARTQHSSIPPAGDYNISEFADSPGATGAAADADWAAVVKCMQEVYSPSAITVTDQEPNNTSCTEAIIAGQPGGVGRPIDNLGVAPLAPNCAAEATVLSFSF